MRKRTRSTFPCTTQFALDDAPTLQELQQGTASGALARLLIAYHRHEHTKTPEQPHLQVEAVQAS